MIVYAGTAKVLHWPTQSLWGFAVLFAATLFFILREAFPNHFGILNARKNIIHSQQKMLKRKSFEIETLKLALREARQELMGLHALWLNTKSEPAGVYAPSAPPAPRIQPSINHMIIDVKASNAELSAEERSEIASKIIQKVLPVSNFNNYAIVENPVDRIFEKTSRSFDFN